MDEFLKIVKEYGLLDYVIVPTGISLIGIAFVYIFGTLTDFVSWYRAKNTIGIGMMFYAAFHWFMAYGEKGNFWQDSWSVLVNFSISICIYTWILIRMRERMDSLLDRRVGEDAGNNYKKVDRRKASGEKRKSKD